MNTLTWTAWKTHFLANEQRPPPVIATDPCASPLVLRSLGILQRAETGEGRIAKAIDGVVFHNIDDDYRAAIKLFIREEARHAGLLGALLVAHGERPATKTWRDGVFAKVRRLAGVRFKLFVFLSAEVAAILMFSSIISGLPDGPIRRSLERMLGDEEHHLEFHAQFWRTAIKTRIGRAFFRIAFSLTACAASIAIVLDHLPLLIELGVPAKRVFQRFRRTIGRALSLAC